MIFGLQNAAEVKREVSAGLTTFVTMSYILFVNPSILSQAIQLPENTTAQLLTATALAAAFGSILMGCLAKYPFALAPGMGLNAYFAFSVVLGKGIPWQTALGAVFVSGVMFVFLSVVGFREKATAIIPKDLKYALSAGIGLFIAFIGLQNAHLISSHPQTLVTLGDLAKPEAQIGLFGIAITLLFSLLNFRSAILLGILSSTLIAILIQAPVFQGYPFLGFSHGIIQAPMWPSDLWMAMDIKGVWDIGIWGVVFIFLFVDFFDTAGTFIGLASKLTPENERLPRTTQVFLTDAIATCFSAICGTSTTTCYIESAAGMKAGGKTGLTGVVVGILFLFSLFFWPIVDAIPSCATAPALILIGVSMMGSLKQIDWENLDKALPAFLCFTLIPLTFSIANGIAAGIVTYALASLIARTYKGVHWGFYGLAILLVVRFIYLKE